MPRTPVQSGRFGVSFTSKTGSLRPSDVDIGSPIARHLLGQLDDAGGLVGKLQLAAEHIMPLETTPRTGFFSRVIFEPGM